MGQDPLAADSIVKRWDGSHSIGAGLAGMGSQAGALGSGQRTDVDDDGHAPANLADDGFDHQVSFSFVEQQAFARGAAQVKAVDAVVQQELGQGAQGPRIDGQSRGQWGQQGSENTR